jgi:putative transposase
MHIVSHQVIKYCLQNKIDIIVIGYNEKWKQQINIGKKNNQNFVSIPFNLFLMMLKYK